MKINTITSIINWWVNKTICVLFFTATSIAVTSCKKEEDVNLNSKPPDSQVGITFTDTITIKNSTLLLNDSLTSYYPTYLAFGADQDPEVGDVSAETYFRLLMYSSNVDYTGIDAGDIDSTNLYVYYTYAYGDTLATQEVSVHQLTLPLDPGFPYRTTSSFVTYDPTDIVTPGGGAFAARPYTNAGKGNQLAHIHLTNAFAANLLQLSDDQNNTDFISSFNGLLIKPKPGPSGMGSVITASYSPTTLSPSSTRLVVYFKRNSVRDSAVYVISKSQPAFNKIQANTASSPYISGLMNTGDQVLSASSSERCYVQSGTGIVTKVEMPNLKNFANLGGSIIINKAQLIMPATSGTISYSGFKRYGCSPIELVELDADNTYRYTSSGVLSFVQRTGYNSDGTGYPVVSTFDAANNKYVVDVTTYIQSLINGTITSHGFIIYPYNNAFFTDRTVLNSSNAASDNMRLELYYTLVK